MLSFQWYQCLLVSIFLKTPTFHGWMDGRSCSCMLYIENYFKLEHDWEDRLYELYLDHYCCFNWYHWILSIGINFDLSCILIYVCMYVCFSIPIVSISIGIKLFIHIYVLFVLIISLYL